MDNELSEEEMRRLFMETPPWAIHRVWTAVSGDKKSILLFLHVLLPPDYEDDRVLHFDLPQKVVRT